VPVAGRERFHGAIEFFSVPAGGPDRATLDIVTTAAAQIGAFAGLLDELAALITVRPLAIERATTSAGYRWRSGEVHAALATGNPHERARRRGRRGATC